MDPLYKPGAPLGWATTRIARDARSRRGRGARPTAGRVHLAGGCSTPIRADVAFQRLSHDARRGGRRSSRRSRSRRRPISSTPPRRATASTRWRVAAVVNGREQRAVGRRRCRTGAPLAVPRDQAARRRAERRSRRHRRSRTATAPTTSSSSIPPGSVDPGRQRAEQGHLQDRRLRRPDRRVPVAHRSRLERQPRHLVLADGRARSRRRRQGRGLPADGAVRRDARAGVRRRQGFVLEGPEYLVGLRRRRPARRSPRSTGSSAAGPTTGPITPATARAATCSASPISTARRRACSSSAAPTG